MLWAFVLALLGRSTFDPRSYQEIVAGSFLSSGLSWDISWSVETSDGQHPEART